jgi:hypothetical protein
MADVYWFGGTGNWSDAANHWSNNSGNSPASLHGSIPGTDDNVIIDVNSGFGAGGTLTINTDSARSHDFTCISGHTFTIARTFTNGLYVYGSLTLEAGLTLNAYFLSLYGTGNETITTSGVTLLGLSIIGSGVFTLQDDLITTGELYQENGTLNANNNNITAKDFYFYADTGYTPTVIMGSGIWEATGTNTIWQIDENSGKTVTLTKGTSTIKITNATATAKIIAGGGKIYNNIWFTGAGTGEFRITGSNTFNDFKVDTPPHTLKFTQGTTTTVTSFTVSGTAGNLITISNITGTTKHILYKFSGSTSCDYLNIANSSATGTGTWFAGANSTNSGNNSGWVWVLPTAKTLASSNVG